MIPVCPYKMLHQIGEFLDVAWKKAITLECHVLNSQDETWKPETRVVNVIMAGQPTPPPNVPPPEIAGLIKGLLTNGFWGGTLGGCRLTSHDVRVLRLRNPNLNNKRPVRVEEGFSCSFRS